SSIGANSLYRNRGDLKFEELSEQAAVRQPDGRSFVPWFFDFDNDGKLDLFVGAYDAGIEDRVGQVRGRGLRCARPPLDRSAGGGRFGSVAQAAGVEIPLLRMGANFGDIDNDGWLDMYLATGDPNYETLMPNVMLQNKGGRSFR